MRRAGIVLFSTAIMGVCVATATAQSAADHVDRGYRALEKRDLDRALADFNAALKADPKLVAAYRGRSLAYYHQQRFDLALADLDDAVRLDPNDARLRLERADVYFAKARIEPARSDYDEAVRLAPSDPRARVGRGWFYFLRGQNGLALDDIDEALKLNPNDPFTHWFRAAVLESLNKFDQALAELNETLRLASDDAIACTSRALLRVSNPQSAVYNPQLAFQDISTACSLSHLRNGQILASLARIYAVSGDFSHAVEFAERALDLDADTTKPDADNCRVQPLEAVARALTRKDLDQFRTGKRFAIPPEPKIPRTAPLLRRSRWTFERP